MVREEPVCVGRDELASAGVLALAPEGAAVTVQNVGEMV